jgi:RES domain-containing protein
MSKKKSTRVDPFEVVELFEKITQLFPAAVGFDGVIVRSVPIKYATKNDFYSGKGAAKTGGRWNPVGLLAVYGSLDVLTATQEAYQNINLFGFPMTSIEPRVMAGVKVTIGKALDLTDPRVRAKLGMTLTSMLDEDWESIQASGEEARTQTIGRGCSLAGFEGMIVPSARNRKGKNVVILMANLAKDSEIRILGSDKLPK